MKFKTQIQSDVATGTAPLSVASTTIITNLNADKIDGLDLPSITGNGGKLLAVNSGATVLEFVTAESTLPANLVYSSDATTGTPVELASAVDVNITDAGAYYTSTNVEGALQEVGALLVGLQSALDTLLG